jgi:hypothetical protein
MPDVPFPITGETEEDKRKQIWELIRHLYEDRIGGGELGDVFQISGDLFELKVSSTGGLEKSSNNLQIKVYSTGGLQTDVNGAAIKCKTDGGLETDADGLAISGRVFLEGSASFNPAEIADDDSEAVNVTVTGAEPGDVAIGGFDQLGVGWECTATVTNSNIVSVRIWNRTGGAVNLGAGTAYAQVWTV